MNMYCHEHSISTLSVDQWVCEAVFKSYEGHGRAKLGASPPKHPHTTPHTCPHHTPKCHQPKRGCTERTCKLLTLTTFHEEMSPLNEDAP